ncbi:PREDICTED: E3 ubiquitin-protein ligase UPL5-like [Tarenaya hassleriana]|uniref:E3 ubiquitin-protein ligase UPL5-like n=1 Tax=Tarenaya hassleriana TaxID=28532 RepID=UPI00053C3240|nr:PREDICTED: E3 ubiquitin-protein ligase UPL5-like [Tarenaya hassleriana]XP_010529477.1 PREDICTED: E3 ubiquitin-protein ligase UPL5-like [Tarenaya hassleriana]
MTLARSSSANSAAFHRSSSAVVAGSDLHKRKLEDFASSPDYCDQFHDRMKKHEVDDGLASGYGFPAFSDEYLGSSRIFPSASAAAECSCSCDSSTRVELGTESTRLQLFVKTMSEGKTIVLQADKHDTVEHLHRQLELMTGIPVTEQRLIYSGRQLQYEQSLGDYAIGKDASLNLVGRMRSTEHPLAWQMIDDMMSTVCRMCRGEPLRESTPCIEEKLTVFFTMIPRDNSDTAADYLRIFLASSAPAALVMLYVSSIEVNKLYAESYVGHFLTCCRNLPKPFYNHCIPMVLEFCKLLRKVAPHERLYMSCRKTLGSMLESVEGFSGFKHKNDGGGLFYVQEIFPFISELADKILKDLVCSMDSVGKSETFSSDVRDFSTFLLPLRRAILYRVGFSLPINIPLQKRGSGYSALELEIGYLHLIFKNFLSTMEKCLDKVEHWLGEKRARDSKTMPASWSDYLAVLKVINSISNFYQSAKEQLLDVLKSRRASVCALISFAKRADDHQWILEYKEVTNFEARRHLVMTMFPDVKDEFEELHEMLIDRSHLLAESFEYIGRADPESLHGGLFIEFKNEEATGPGVLREWFFVVCQAIFNPANALFVPSFEDRRRFYPNPASRVDPMHLEYFTFSGRVIALALMHKVQVGVLLDRVFFVQLAGMQVSLEDIKDADPVLYRGCKNILGMDPEDVDSDILGLTFAREVEELGKRNVVELCPGGKSIAVTSKNRHQYVELLIQHRFVTSISEQVSHFSRGFNDILSDPKPLRSFFKGIDLEDLDWMLRGRESAINIDDWKAHTEYNGFKETDNQIVWFWTIVEGMTEDEKRSLLFFWTSIKFLPVEGFVGLSSKLHIHKLYDTQNPLPLSHTCFYRICLPIYSSFAVMEQRLRFITEDHVSSSFGIC